MKSLDPKNYLDEEFAKLDKELAERFDLTKQNSWSVVEKHNYKWHAEGISRFKDRLETIYMKGKLKIIMEIQAEREERLKFKIAKQFVGRLSTYSIAEITGLTYKQVEEL